ncbi:MAG: FecR domain-containing protein [Flavobacterium sp. JAD_PAG50586_2]|nr:MAG: FecR domain-containing protein [Flavobacterium sp. JAD_PAG50586_2]
MENENETYLADWLADKISDEQLKKLVTEEAFLDFQQLKNTVENFTVSNPDLDKNFEAVKQKFHVKKAKKRVKVFPLWRYSAIAATFLLLFGLYQSFHFSNTNVTGFGVSKNVTLPDNSIVTLNAKSKLSYPNLFQINRTLSLEGEAYFEVEKGSTFTVETALGCVKVLGTKFNVNAYEDYFEVICYEGKVSVASKGQIVIITPSESIRFYDHTSENFADNTNQKPQWLTGESDFRNVPFKYVIDQFKKQYDVVIAFPKTAENVKFTGTFTHKNIETALQSICIPLQLKYRKDSSGKIIISE